MCKEQSQSTRMLDYKEVSARMALSRSTITSLVANGEFIQPIMVPGIRKYMFSENELNEYMQKLQENRSADDVG